MSVHARGPKVATANATQVLRYSSPLAYKEIPVLTNGGNPHLVLLCNNIPLWIRVLRQRRLAMDSALVGGQRALLHCQELSQILVRAWIRTAVSSGSEYVNVNFRCDPYFPTCSCRAGKIFGPSFECFPLPFLHSNRHKVLTIYVAYYQPVMKRIVRSPFDIAAWILCSALAMASGTCSK